MERYSVPYPMVVGAGALAQLGSVVRKCGVRRPLVVTDRGLVDCGLAARALESLGPLGPGATVFDGVCSNPREEDITAASALFKERQADGIVAFGGGSAIDAAKGLKLLVGHGGTITDYDFLRGGLKKIVHDGPPLVAVPTTAGTGSEVSRGALIVTQQGDVVRKTLVASPRLVPDWSILDGELTVSLPPHLTAGTGMDAVTHCIEEFISPREHPTVEAIALGGLRRLAVDLPRVMKAPDDVTARTRMLVSAMMGGIGFEKGLGVVHSISHAIGALHDVHHGLLNALLLPSALEFNRGHYAPGAPETLARTVGLDAANDDEALERVIAWIRDWNARWSIPSRLRDLPIDGGNVETILDRALEDHCHRTNPRPCSRDDLRELWEASW